MQRLGHINKDLVYMLAFLAPIVSEFCYNWYYLYYSAFVIIDYSGIMFSDFVRGLVSTLLDTTLNLMCFYYVF